MGDRVEWIESRERLADRSLIGAWDRLAATDGTPFSRSAWFRCWWDAFGPPRLATCALWRGDDLAAVFPLYRDRDRLHALANVHSPFFRPLAVDPAARASVLDEAIDACSELEVFGLPENEPSLTALERAASARGSLHLREPQHVSPIVDTTGDLERYRRERRSDLSETARRRRKMTRENGAVFRSIERPEDLQAEVERGLRLEGSGWKGEQGTAILSDPRTAAFYRSIAAAFHATDELRLSALELDGELASFDLAFLTGGRYWLLKTAYDESRARLGPGMALRLSVVERCFELGVEAHEFLGGDLEYKRRFATAERAHVGFRAYRRAPLPAGRYAYRQHLRPLLRHAYRRFRAPRSGRQRGA